MRWRVLAAVVCAAVAGCGDEGPPNPAPIVTPTTTATTVTTTPPTPEAPKRTVSMRNPMGGPPSNLFIDGDFEFSIVLQGSGPQAGWYSFGNQDYVRGETGGICRSGLRCAVMSSGQGLFGRGTSAKDSGMVAELWAKVPEGKGCGVVSVLMFTCSFSSSFGINIPAVDSMPGSDGWCQYRGGINPQDEGMCVFVENTLESGQEAIVDAALLIPSDGSVPLRAMTRQTGARADRVRQMATIVRKRTPFGNPPMGVDQLNRARR